MQVALVQLDVAWEQREANHARVLDLISREKPQAGTLVVLPEMFSTGFSMNVAGIADQLHADEAFLRSIAREYEVYILAGTVKRGTSDLGRNCAIAIDPAGRTIANYCKLHPFSLGEENRHYEAGDEVVTFACGEFTVAPFVCYDLRFPEIFRAAVRRGVNLFTVIANWPDTRVEHWITLLRARAIENQAYVVGVNRIGRDPTLHYPGRSIVVDPMGQFVLDAGDAEGVFACDIAIDRVAEVRAKLPFLKDMRSDAL